MKEISPKNIWYKTRPFLLYSIDGGVSNARGLAILGSPALPEAAEKDTETFSVGITIQSGRKKCIHSLLINIFGINLNGISISG